GTPASYRESGRVGEVIWTRFYISLTMHPEWPFGNLNEVYSGCKNNFPTGLAHGGGNVNSHCVWQVYAQQHGLSNSGENTFDKTFEKVMRDAFFYAVFTYPRQSLETFLYYKPLMFANT